MIIQLGASASAQLEARMVAALVQCLGLPLPARRKILEKLVEMTGVSFAKMLKSILL